MLDINIAIYKEKGKYCACIGAEGDSGYEMAEDTKEALATRVAEYFEMEIVESFD